MFIIKPYEEKYKADVQQVCINTGPDAAATDPKTSEYIETDSPLPEYFETLLKKLS